MCLKMVENQGYHALFNANLHTLTCKIPILQKVK